MTNPARHFLILGTLLSASQNRRVEITLAG